MVTVNVDASQPTVVGSAQQRDAAVASYLQKFDAARSRGEGDQTLMSFFKEAFSALHQSYETAAPSPLSLIGKSKDAVPLAHRGALSGMADFSASITQGPVASNPYRTGEQDSFSFGHATHQHQRCAGPGRECVAGKRDQRSPASTSRCRA